MKIATVCALVALALVSCSPAASSASSPAPSAMSAAPASPPLATAGWVVYYARDLASPVAVTLEGPVPGPTIDLRVRQRLDVLAGGPRSADGGAFNVLPGMRAHLQDVAVSAGLATLDFRAIEDDWGIDGSAMLRAFVQQVIYTASEEAGITHVLITQNGGAQAVIGGEGLVISEPQGRAGLGYEGLSPDQAARVIRMTVAGARPLLIPTWIPSDWTVSVRADAGAFSATYADPAGTRTVSLAIALANIPPPGPETTRTAPAFHGDRASLYQVSIATDARSERWLSWTEAGISSVPGSRGVPYVLGAIGLTDLEFWRVADSLHPNQI